MTELLRSLGAHDRIAALGVGIVALSLLLPWHGVTFAGGLVKTPVGSFGFPEAAIVLTLAAAIYLIVRSARGEPMPRPLHLGTLVAVAGAWTAVLVGYGMLDRPDFRPLDSGHVGLRFGIFIALGGAALIVVGGLRMRRDELAAGAKERAAGPQTKAGE